MSERVTTYDPKGTVARRWRGEFAEPAFARLANTPAAQELGSHALYLIDELLSFQPDLAPADAHSLRLLVLASLMGQRQGSTRLPLAHLEEAIAPFVGAAEIAAEAGAIRALLAEGRAPAIVGAVGEYRPLILDGEADGGWLYHHRMLHYEERLVAALAERLERPHTVWPEGEGAGDVGAALREILDHAPRLPDGAPMRLSAEQQYALLTAAHASLTVITGGPGTGKTSIVVSLLRLLVRLGVEPEAIALAAPTGKAANRMGESIATQLRNIEAPTAVDESLHGAAERARTLHRLLDYSQRTGQFRHHQNNPLLARWVIVDEASMIDLVLMERLVRSVRHDAHLVLLGDAEQLPSVETGTVLRDLIPSVRSTATPWRELVVEHDEEELDDAESDEPTAEHVVRLQKSHRMDANDPRGRAILEAASKVRLGKTPKLPARPAGAPRMEKVERIVTPADDLPAAREALRDFLKFWYETRICGLDGIDAMTFDHTYRLVDGAFAFEDLAMLQTLFDHYNRFRILCLTRVWATGADAINTIFHRRFLQRSGLDFAPEFVPGEPVLMLRNDYDRGLFNGDQGIVLRVEVDGEARLMAVFPSAAGRGGFEAHHLTALRGHLDRAFAMTVHKAQGSEFDEVAVILPEEDMPLLTREILYTAMTRSRRGVAVVGRDDLFELGVERSVVRHSGLAEKLGRR